MNDGGGDGRYWLFEIKVWADTTKFTNVRIAGLGECRYLVREGEMFNEDETLIASRAGGAET